VPKWSDRQFIFTAMLGHYYVCRKAQSRGAANASPENDSTFMFFLFFGLLFSGAAFSVNPPITALGHLIKIED